jgi:hypothetical protein
MANINLFIAGELPDTSNIKRVKAADILTKDDTDEFYLFEGVISALTAQVGRTYSPQSEDVYNPTMFYEAILQDSTGEVRIHPPWMLYGETTYQQLKDVHESKHPVEVIIYLAYGNAINKVGLIDPEVRKLYRYPALIQKSSTDPSKFEPISTTPLITTNRIRQVGRNWQIAYDGQTHDYTSGDGFIYLKEILLNPNRKLNAIGLHRMVKGSDNPPETDQIEKDYEEDAEYAKGGSEGDLDSKRRTIAEYKKTLIKNSEARLAAQATGDYKKIEKLDSDNEFIAKELRKLTGQSFEKNVDDASAKDKAAQEAVSQAILRAFRKIEEKQPDLVIYFRSHIVRSFSCEFILDPDHEALWDS